MGLTAQDVNNIEKRWPFRPPRDAWEIETDVWALIDEVRRLHQLLDTKEKVPNER